MALPVESCKTAWQLRADLDAKKISAVELAQEYLERSKSDSTNSYITICEEQALERAKLYDAGKLSGKFAGIPLALKDLFVTKGVKTTCASKILENYIPPYNGTAVELLENAGAINLGKLNMDEFAMGSSNENSAYGSVALPQNEKFVPGGSSGGSAAAVAANLAPFTLGTDTGGSVRQPASFCGVVGMKPSYGRISRYGVIAFASSLDQVGSLALDVQDTADLMEVLCGHDPKDSTSSKRESEKFGDIVSQIRSSSDAGISSLKGKKIGVPSGYFVDGLHEETRSNIEQAVESLRKAGAEIIDVELPHSKYALAVYYVVAVSEASTNLSRYDGVRFGPRVLSDGTNTSLDEMYAVTRGTLFGDEVKRRILLGTFALSAGYYDAYFKKACQVRNLIGQDFMKAFQSVDLILGPTTPTPAFERGGKIDDPLAMYLNDIFTVPVNLAGLPALSMPWGETKAGLPIGLQLVAPPFAESSLLQSAAAIESLYKEVR